MGFICRYIHHCLSEPDSIVNAFPLLRNHIKIHWNWLLRVFPPLLVIACHIKSV